MASLAGKADPTIVSMAYRAGMANVPHDYSKYYQAYADQYKELLGDIETSFKTYQLNKEIGLKELDNAMAVFNEPLNAQIIDSEYEKMQSEIQAQRKSYPGTKDPKALQDWNRKNSQIIGRYEQSRTALVDFKKLYDGGVLDLEGMDDKDIIFYTDVSKYQANTNLESGKYNNQADVFMQNNPDATPRELMEYLGVGKNIVVKYNDPKTGEYTYVSQTGEETSTAPYVAQPSGAPFEDREAMEPPTTTNPVYVAKKASELTNVSRKADDAVVEVGDEFQNTIIRAKNTELPYDGFKQQDINRLEKIAKTAITRNDNSFSYLTRQKFGGQEKTFEEALRSATDDIGLTAKIITTLGATESDGNNILEITDFATEASYNTVVNGILGGLDKDLSISLWAEYTVENAYRPGHVQYKKEKKVTPPGAPPGAPPGPPPGKFGGFGSYEFSTGGTDTQEGRSINWSEAVRRRERLQGGLDFKGEHGHWKPTGDGNYTGEYNNLDQVYSPWEIADIESLWQSGESEDTFNLAEEVKEKKEAKAKGMATLDIIDNTVMLVAESDRNINDDDAAKALNKNFDLNKSKKHWFVPFEGRPGMGNYGFGLLDADDTSTNDIMLLENGKPYKENGEIVRFKTGADATQADIDKINEILGYKIKKIKTTSGGGGVGSKYNTVK